MEITQTTAGGAISHISSEKQVMDGPIVKLWRLPVSGIRGRLSRNSTRFLLSAIESMAMAVALELELTDSVDYRSWSARLA